MTVLRQHGRQISERQLAVLDEVSDWPFPVVDVDPLSSLLDGTYDQESIDNYFRLLAQLAAIGPGQEPTRYLSMLADGLRDGSSAVLLLAVRCGLFSLPLARLAAARLEAAEAWRLAGSEARDGFKDLLARLREAEAEQERWHRFLARVLAPIGKQDTPRELTLAA